jgi:ribosomal protein S18 acetylase RimI-like enzyme
MDGEKETLEQHSELLEPEKIDVAANINELFVLDAKVAEASPAILPLETPRELEDFLIKDHHSDTYLQKTKNGNAVGYLSVIDLDGDAMEILNIGVDPKAQGKGYGRSMMQLAEELAKNLGKKKITLVTNPKNAQAIHFYKKLGYQITAEIENYYGDGEARYALEKLLS